MKNFSSSHKYFAPIPAAVGQYFDEAAQAIAGTGAEVTILTANRGYDNPKEKFAAIEDCRGYKSSAYPFPPLVRQASRFVFLLNFPF